MKVLYVVPNVPSPIRPRPFNLVRALSQFHEVSVLCVATNEADHRFAAELQAHCHSLEIIKVSRWRSAWNCLTALFSSKSLRYAYFYSPALRRRVEEMVSRGEVDLVHAEHLKCIPMVETVVGKIPSVFDAVDCVSMFESRRRKVVRNPLLKAFSWIEWRKMVFREVNAVQRFNRTVICSGVDKENYPGPSSVREKIDVVLSCVDLRYFAFKKYESQKNLLVLCGKFDYFPNADAAVYFVHSVWPLLRRKRPELILEIVGSRPPQSVRRLDGKDNVRVVASVPDIRPHLGRAWVALSPIRIRAGIQTKIIEAMALGVPVVSHRICCEGLAVESGKELLVADTPEEFASAVEVLLDNPLLRARLVEAGRNYVERHHDWNDSVKALCDSYAKATVDFSNERQVRTSL
jgi:polysaccharide biosynthesis protein PslH